MSLFGQSSNTGGFNFGNATANTSQSQSGLFNTTQNKPFSLGLSTTTAQPTQNTGLFGTSTTQQKPLFGGLSTNQQPSTGLFGGPVAQNSAFNQSQIQQQQAQRPLDQTLRFGTSDAQQSIEQAKQGKEPWWQEGRGMGVYRSVPEQMNLIQNKWDPASLNSPLRTYLYQHVENETEALKYTPGPGEDPDKWEEAVQKRPGPTWVPVIARGFRELGQRAQKQREVIAKCNVMLREINTSLDIQLDTHHQKVAARLAESRRRHKTISQRTLALAVKVQTLKNRGYVMDNAEEELKAKLTALEREVLDPSLNAREQEVWARMLGIRERAKHLKVEMEKLQPVAENDEPLLDEETVKQARKVCSDISRFETYLTISQTLDAYDTQLQHLQKELRLVHEEYADWERQAAHSNHLRSR